MLNFLHQFLQGIQPLLVPVCFILAWLIILSLSITLWSAIRDTLARAKKMHAIPCTHCQYFTNDYRLKCPVQPRLANTEKAINCRDYRRIDNTF